MFKLRINIRLIQNRQTAIFDVNSLLECQNSLRFRVSKMEATCSTAAIRAYHLEGSLEKSCI